MDLKNEKEMKTLQPYTICQFVTSSLSNGNSKFTVLQISTKSSQVKLLGCEKERRTQKVVNMEANRNKYWMYKTINSSRLISLKNMI